MEKVLKDREVQKIERKRDEQVNKMTTVTKTVNKEGEKIVVKTQNPYERETFIAQNS